MKILMPNNTPPHLNSKIFIRNELNNKNCNKLQNDTTQNSSSGLYSQRLNYGICFGKNINFDNILNNKKISTVSFCAGEESKNPLYDEFMEKYKEVYGDRPVQDVINEKINDLTPIGIGKDKRVYKFPGLEDYVIGEWYKHSQEIKHSLLKPCDIRFPKYNFGEYFMSNGYYGICTYIDGAPNSYPDYHEVMRNVGINASLTPEMAQEYLSKLRIINEFPQEAFDDFAAKIKYLTDNGQYIDIINPNNILINTSEKKFYIIDLPEPQELEFTKQIKEDTYKNNLGLYEMIGVLIDPKFQYFFLNSMSSDEVDEVKCITRNVINKLIIAAKSKQFNLNDSFYTAILEYCDKNTIFDTIKLIIAEHSNQTVQNDSLLDFFNKYKQYFKPLLFMPGYRKFKETYKDILP